MNSDSQAISGDGFKISAPSTRNSSKEEYPGECVRSRSNSQVPSPRVWNKTKILLKNLYLQHDISTSSQRSMDLLDGLIFWDSTCQKQEQEKEAI